MAVRSQWVALRITGAKALECLHLKKSAKSKARGRKYVAIDSQAAYEAAWVTVEVCKWKIKEKRRVGGSESRAELAADLNRAKEALAQARAGRDDAQRRFARAKKKLSSAKKECTKCYERLDTALDQYPEDKEEIACLLTAVDTTLLLMMFEKRRPVKFRLGEQKKSDMTDHIISHVEKLSKDTLRLEPRHVYELLGDGTFRYVGPYMH